MENDGIVLGDGDVLGHSQSSLDLFRIGSGAFKSKSCLFADELASSEDSNVL